MIGFRFFMNYPDLPIQNHIVLQKGSKEEAKDRIKMYMS
jgi:hypothetical protein